MSMRLCSPHLRAGRAALDCSLLFLPIVQSTRRIQMKYDETLGHPRHSFLLPVPEIMQPAHASSADAPAPCSSSPPLSLSRACRAAAPPLQSPAQTL